MRIIGSLIYIAFGQFVTSSLRPISNSYTTIREDRKYRIKDLFYQFDRYQGVVQSGSKLNGDVCMATDILDQNMLECYFSNPQRVAELKSAAFRIVDKLLAIVKGHKTDIAVVEDLSRLPLSEYPHHTQEEFEAFTTQKNKANKRGKDRAG